MEFLSTFSADIVHQETLKSEHQGKAYYNHRQGNAIGNERPESELDRKSQIQSRDKDEEKAEHGHHRTVGMTVYNRPYTSSLPHRGQKGLTSALSSSTGQISDRALS